MIGSSAPEQTSSSTITVTNSRRTCVPSCYYRMLFSIVITLSNQHCARIAIRHADVLPSQSPAQNEKMAQQSHELSEGSQN
jgi:hypothetical protein